jgi:hypothetical protein
VESTGINKNEGNWIARFSRFGQFDCPAGVFFLRDRSAGEPPNELTTDH